VPFVRAIFSVSEELLLNIGQTGTSFCWLLM